MKINWTTISEAIKLTVTVVVYSFAKELPPDLDNQFIGSVIDVGVAVVSALATLIILNALFGRPELRVEWVVANQTPRSNRPDLSEAKTGVFFRYSIHAETHLARLVLWILRKYEIRARLGFAPSENIKISPQYFGDSSVNDDRSITTSFTNGLSRGSSLDGEFSLRLKQGRSVDTPVDCSVTLQPHGQSAGKIFAKLLCRWVKKDTLIEGFLLKGDS